MPGAKVVKERAERITNKPATHRKTHILTEHLRIHKRRRCYIKRLTKMMLDMMFLHKRYGSGLLLSELVRALQDFFVFFCRINSMASDYEDDIKMNTQVLSISHVGSFTSVHEGCSTLAILSN